MTKFGSYATNSSAIKIKTYQANAVCICEWIQNIARGTTNPDITSMQTIQVPLKSILKYLTWIFLATEFASFVAGEIIQVKEAMPGSVVPLVMFF